MAVYNSEYGSRIDVLLTPIAVCEAVELTDNMQIPNIYRTSNCMWDTGSTNTLISKAVVEELGLKRYSKCLVSDNTAVEERDTYLVHVGLPTGTTALKVEAMLTLSEDYDVVIGMDIINHCDFYFTNKNGKSTFSLRHPSIDKIVLN